MPRPIKVASTRLNQPARLDEDQMPEPGEKGSGFSIDQVFEGFDNGKVFIYPKARIRDYKDALDTDGKMASVEKLLSFPIIAAPWEIKGVKGDTGQAEWVREFFDASYENGGMKTHIDEVIAQMNFGQSIGQVFFEKCPMVRESDEANVFEKIVWRPPEGCRLALDAKKTEIIGFQQQPMNMYGPSMLPNQKTNDQGWIEIYGQRAFIYTHGRWRDPIDGYSAMKVPYWCFQTKRKIRFLWYQYLETTALPKSLVQNADIDQAIIDARKIATMKNRDVVGLSSETEVNPYESSGHGAQQFIEAIRFLDSEMSNSILGGFMDLVSSAASGKGSYALSADQSTLFLKSRRVVARDMARQITSQIIAPLIRWNFGRNAPVPQFVFGPLDEANRESVMEMFNNAVTASQGTTLPIEFFEQLAIRVANITELDPTRIQDSFDKLRETESDPAKQVVGAVALATQLTQQKQVEQQGKAQTEQLKLQKDAQKNPLGTPQNNDPNIPAPPGKNGSNGNSSSS